LNKGDTKNVDVAVKLENDKKLLEARNEKIYQIKTVLQNDIYKKIMKPYFDKG